MAGAPGVTGVDPNSWQVTILPLPKRFTRGADHGFCGGHPVGRAETARARSLGCWWPGGEPELLALAGHKDVPTGRACGDVIPGQWSNSATGAMGAVLAVTVVHYAVTGEFSGEPTIIMGAQPERRSPRMASRS